MGRKDESITLSLSLEDKETLEKLALIHDCKWGDKPNISRLLQKIANGSLKISDPSAEERKISEIKALMRSPEVLKLQKLLEDNRL